MQRDRADATDSEPHVFDQTNGLVNTKADHADGRKARRPDARIVSGIAMLSVKRP